MAHYRTHGDPDAGLDWCHGLGCLIVITAMVGWGILYYRAVKPLFLLFAGTEAGRYEQVHSTELFVVFTQFLYLFSYLLLMKDLFSREKNINH